MALIAPIANDTGTGGTTTYTTLRYGSTGTAVVSLQKQLASYGFYTGSLDGKFGPATLSAVKAFQQATGNTVDGIAGPATQKTLATYKPPATTTTTQPAPIVKPQATAQQGYTDTGTSQTAPAAAPVSTQAQPIAVQQPIPIVKPQAAPAPTAGITDTGTGTPMQQPVQQLPQKPQAAAQQGYTDTGTGGTVSQIKPVTVAPEGIEKPQEVAQRGYTDTATGGVVSQIDGLPDKPQEIARRGMTDTGTGAEPFVPSGPADYSPGMLGASYNQAQESLVEESVMPAVGALPNSGYTQEQLDQSQREAQASLVEESDMPVAGRQEKTRTGSSGGGGYVSGGGSTGGTGLTPTVGGESGTGMGAGGQTETEIVPTTGGGTGTGTIADEGFEVEPNPYIEQITSMQFSYDPNTDENYLRMAAALENQITQSMVGRGGLYSSVTGYAIQIGLTNLMMEMYEKAYQSFMDERDFLMEMSRDHEARVQADFNRRMDIAQYQFALQKEAFAQQMDVAKFNFAQQQEAFDQQLAIMEYNFAVEKEKFDQRMAQAAHNLSVNRLNYQKQQDALNYQLKQQEIALANQQLLVEQEYDQMKRDVTFDKTVLAAKLDKAKELNDRWLDDVYATDPEVQAFFGITSRTTWQGGSGVRQRVFEALDAEKDAVATRALELEMYDVFTGAKQDWAESDTTQTITTKVGDTTISTTKKVPSSER